MRRTVWAIAALVAVLHPTGSARADVTTAYPEPPALTASLADLAPFGSGTASLIPLAVGPQLASIVYVSKVPEPQLESIRYVPRHVGPRNGALRYEPRRTEEYHLQSNRPTTVTQIHGGVFTPEAFPHGGFLLGLREAAALGDHMQIGIHADWRYKQEEQATVLSRDSLPTGGAAQVKRVLSRVYSHLIPILGYAQLGLGRLLPLSPYIGGGAGYEIYYIDADDFETGGKFEAQYGGFAWQAWGGVELALSSSARLVGEAFINQAELGRDVVDPSGQIYRETLNMNGVGMRFGLNWRY